MTDFGCHINGEWSQGNGPAFESIDPASALPIWSAGSASQEQVDAAFTAAKAMSRPWARTDLQERLAIIRRYRDQVEAEKDAFAELISMETGKALWEANGEIAATMGKIELSIKSYEERTGSKVSETPFGQASLRHRPHGVMAVLGPYNFPVHLPNGHIVPALIAGDTIVFKPSELTPAVAGFMVRLWQQAGLPDGVINLVQGARDTGAAVLDHPLLQGVLFTGSAQTGAFIHKKFAGRPEVILALEMGGNNPLVIWDAADYEAAANIAVQSAFITSGQRCTCARRLILPAGKEGDAVLEAIVSMADRLIIAPWDAQPSPFMSALVSEHAANQVLKDQEGHCRSGANAIRFSKAQDWSKAALSPGILDMQDTDAVDEETFGPLLQVYRAGTFDVALQRANATRFGLAAGLVSDSKERWKEFTTEIEAGIVNFNRPTTGAASSLPFGGPGISGNHRPGAWYAADYCAWPMASQEAISPSWIDVPGLGR